MSLFGSSESFLGIDIGNSAIKLVELENVKGRPKLLTYGYVEESTEVLTSHTPQARERVAEAIQKVVEQSHASSRQVVAALPTYTVFSSIIHLPEMPKKELVSAVNWEAKKFIPMPLEEMVLDWKILEKHDGHQSAMQTSTPLISSVGQGQPGDISSPLSSPVVAGGGADAFSQPPQEELKITKKEKKFLKILLTAAPKDLVSRYLEIFKQAKLHLVSLETESFALERSLVGNDPSAIMIIDIGATATTISIVVDAVPLINRSIDIGGQTITKAIANSLNIDSNRAEQFKRDFGFAKSTNVAAGQIPKRIEFMASSVMNEVKYVLNLYQSQGNGTVEKIILSGGSAWLPHITEYVSTMVGVKTFIGDPWARVMYPVEMKPVLQEVGPRLAVSVGLAMREIS